MEELLEDACANEPGSDEGTKDNISAIIIEINKPVATRVRSKPDLTAEKLQAALSAANKFASAKSSMSPKAKASN